MHPWERPLGLATARAVPRDRPVNRMAPDPVPGRPYAELTIGLVARARSLIRPGRRTI